jgi:hypothetical protein
MKYVGQLQFLTTVTSNKVIFAYGLLIRMISQVYKQTTSIVKEL